MRIVVIGGAGVQGRAAAHSAANAGATGDEIVIVSRDKTRAEAAVARLRVDFAGCHIIAAVADLTIPGSFDGLIRTGDFVLNAAAPFFKLGALAAERAIDAGAHYADICDDWEATDEILKLGPRAHAAGSKLVTGFGSAPGLTSMLAVLAMQKLETVEQIYTAWPLSGGGQEGGGPETDVPMIHFVQCCVGPIRQMRNGRLTDDEPLQPVTVALGAGQSFTGYSVGSPEAMTLPTGIASIRNSIALMRINERMANDLAAVAGAVRDGDVTMADAARMLTGGNQDDSMDIAEDHASLCAVAIGKRKGHNVACHATLSAWPAQAGYASAGTALGLAPVLIQEAVSLENGAHSIEHAIDPNVYLDRLAKAIDPTSIWAVEVDVRNI